MGLLTNLGHAKNFEFTFTLLKHFRPTGGYLYTVKKSVLQAEISVYLYTIKNPPGENLSFYSVKHSVYLVFRKFRPSRAILQYQFQFTFRNLL